MDEHEKQTSSGLSQANNGLGPGQQQIKAQELKDKQEQQTEQATKLPEPLQGLVDLVGPDKPKGQAISPGQPKLTPREYKEIADTYWPKPKILKNSLWAFGVGGTICVIGQIVQNIFGYYGIAGNGGSSATSVLMIFIGAFLTGLGVYDEIGRRAGAGSIVPITGFANSMVAPAMEFKREGFVLGVGAKLFVIAGPVLVYGIMTSFIVGLIKYLLG